MIDFCMPGHILSERRTSITSVAPDFSHNKGNSVRFMKCVPIKEHNTVRMGVAKRLVQQLHESNEW